MANDNGRMIRACPGTQCQRGQQDCAAVELMLDEKYGGRRTQGEIKMGVSGCPHRCAENGGKDVSLVGTDTGWEIYVGRNGDPEFQIAEPLAKDLSTDRALDLIDCVLAYHRENAEPGEGVLCLIQRLGLEHMRRALEL